MRDYKKLDVWKKSHEMYMYIRRNITTKFPGNERYELTTQLLRAALSVPLNIAEGAGRDTNKDFTHFLDISLGSTNESDYCCFVALELKYISTEEYSIVSKLLNEVRAMLINFIKFLRKVEGGGWKVEG
jgi:four helix bundle protein